MATDKTVTATLNTTQARLEEVADDRGYQETVYEEQDITDEDGQVVGTERVEVDNPQSKLDFIKEEMEKTLTNEIVRDKIQEIRQQKRQEEQNEIEQTKEQAKQDLEVTIE